MHEAAIFVHELSQLRQPDLTSASFVEPAGSDATEDFHEEPTPSRSSRDDRRSHGSDAHSANGQCGRHRRADDAAPIHSSRLPVNTPTLVVTIAGLAVALLRVPGLWRRDFVW